MFRGWYVMLSKMASESASVKNEGGERVLEKRLRNFKIWEEKGL